MSRLLTPARAPLGAVQRPDIGGLAAELDALHGALAQTVRDRRRARVRRDDQTDHPRSLQHVKGVAEGGARPFGRVAVPPVGAREPPAELEVRPAFRLVAADPPDELRGLPAL